MKKAFFIALMLISCINKNGIVDNYNEYIYNPLDIVPSKKAAIKSSTKSIHKEVVFFNFNSKSFLKDYASSLKIIINKLNENENYSLVIEGYADQSGTKAYNLALTQKRADSVLEKLLETAPNLKKRKITSIGKGIDFSKKSSVKKRRVELKIFNE